MRFFRVDDTGILFTQEGPMRVNFGPADPPPPAIEPLPLNQRLIITGHSIPDAIAQVPLAEAVTEMGGTIQRWSSTGPFASAMGRWEGRPINPDEVRGLMEAPGASYDAFIGIEAHGDTVFIGSDPVGRASVQTHLTWSDGYGYALLWHNLAASTGAQTHYMSFWRNDPAEVFGADWRAAQVPELPLWDGIIDYVNANRAAGTPAMRLVPLLSVFCAIYDAIQAGQITGITMADLFFDDVHSSSPIGTWVLLATVFSVVYRRHPDTLPSYAGSQAGISTALAQQLRPVIWAACLNDPRSGLS
jgi:hypothetical protein